MTIQPLPTNRPPEISVTEAVEPAYERVKVMLFKPFDFTKWIILGFCAWLAGLGEYGSGGASFHSGNTHQYNGRSASEAFRQFYHEAANYITDNLSWLIPVVVIAALLLLGIWIGMLWLSSRGKLMLLHCVALNVAEVETPWCKYAKEANSLFRFRLVLWLAGMVVCVPMAVFLGMDIIQMLLRYEADTEGVLLAVALALGLLLAGVVMAVIRKFIVDFVVPILFLRGGTCMQAWREFWQLLAANPGRFTVYILFQIALTVAIGALVIMLFIVTCCIACCLAALPFIGTVLLLPVLIFKRAYPLYYLAQYGEQYDVFPKSPAPATATPLPPG